MSDEQGGAPAASLMPSAELAPPPTPDGRYDGGGGSDYAPAQAPTDTRAALDALSANDKWRADFSGDNGRDAQRHAVAHKSQLVQQQEAPMEPAGETDVGPTVADYKFNFHAAHNMDPEAHASMHSEVSELAHAIGADPHTARSTVEYLDNFMAMNPDAQPPTDEAELLAVIDKRFGSGNDVIERAKALVQSIPEGLQRDRLMNTFDRLDTSTSAWFIGKLAGVHRSRAHG